MIKLIVTHFDDGRDLFEENCFCFRIEKIGAVGLDLQVQELDGAFADLIAAGLDLRKQADQSPCKKTPKN